MKSVFPQAMKSYAIVKGTVSMTISMVYVKIGLLASALQQVKKCTILTLVNHSGI